MEPIERRYMEQAIEEARKCVSEPGLIRPKVGAVVVRGGKVLATAYRGETEPGHHAEYVALEQKLADTSLAGATVFTTLEPCTGRNPPKRPCVERIIERKVGRVVIGTLDPNPVIQGKGWGRLREQNIVVEMFDPDLLLEIEDLNREFHRSFHEQKGDRVRRLRAEDLAGSPLDTRFLFVFCGPSTVGKDTIAARVRGRMIELGVPFKFAQKYTTRQPRPGENVFPSESWHDPSSQYTYLSDEDFETSTDIVGSYEKYGGMYGFSRRHLASTRKSDRVLAAIYGDVEELSAFLSDVERQFDRRCRAYLLKSPREHLETRLEIRRGMSAEIARARLAELKLDVGRIERLRLSRDDFVSLSNGNSDDPDAVAERIVNDAAGVLGLLQERAV